MSKKTGTIYRDGMEQKHCPVCKEYIHSEARVCLYCKSDQTLGKLKMAGELLVWIGGITAIISLCMGLLEVNSFFKNWREKKQTVVELVDAAKMQMNDGDHNRAWSFVDEALKLSPGSRYARDFQVELAMGWLKEIKFLNSNIIKYHSLPIDSMLSTLYRGAVSKKYSQTGDIFAFIAWANCLRYAAGDRGLDIVQMFEKALTKEPDNIYTNVMYGIWQLRNIGGSINYHKKKFQSLAKYFLTALDNGKETKYVHSIMAEYLGNVNENIMNKSSDIIVFLNLLRNRGEIIEQSSRLLLLKNYDLFYIEKRDDEIWNDRKKTAISYLLSSISFDEVRETYLWLTKGIIFKKEFHDIQQKIIFARLLETNNEYEEALSILKKTKPRLRGPYIEKKKPYIIITQSINRIKEKELNREINIVK